MPTDIPPFEKMTGAATALGWTCLAQEWSGYHSHYLFECSRGHRFEKFASQMLYGNTPASCTQCNKEDLGSRWYAAVANKGGVLVGGVFKGLRERYRLKCAEGHEWEVEGRKVAQGHWCPECARVAGAKARLLKDGLQCLADAAKSLGGRCLSSEYTGVRGRYEFECAQGHRWEAAGRDVQRGLWCELCRVPPVRRDPQGLARLRNAAQARGGECLSTEFIGGHAKYDFRCAKGHEWQTTGARIYQGYWCPRCGAGARRLGIEKMRETARERGGLCLSQTYVTSRDKLTWQCHLGHVWQAIPGSVRRGAWCPSCAVLARIAKRNNWKRKKYLAVGKTPE